MLKPAVIVALVGVVVAGCSVRTERVVETPAPAATTTTQRTTTVSNNPYAPGTTTTTTYTTPAPR